MRMSCISTMHFIHTTCIITYYTSCLPHKSEEAFDMPIYTESGNVHVYNIYNTHDSVRMLHRCSAQGENAIL